MNKYNVYLTATSSAMYTVEAEDGYDAEEKVYELYGTPSLCAHCSGYGSRSLGLQYVELGEDWEVEGNAELAEE